MRFGPKPTRMRTLADWQIAQTDDPRQRAIPIYILSYIRAMILAKLTSKPGSTSAGTVCENA